MAHTTTADTVAQEHQVHPLGVYFKVWGWLFVLSIASYVVDIIAFDPSLNWIKWTLITLFALLKSTLIVTYFMHLKWERSSLVYAIISPVVFILLMVAFFAAESGHIADVRRAILGG